MMLVPHIAGGSPVISCISAHNRCASARRCSSGTWARNSATDAPVRRIAGPLLAVMPSCSHGPLRVAGSPATRCGFASVLAVVVDAEHVPGRVPERAGLHVVVHGHRSVDPGAAERFGLGQGLLDVGDAGVDRGPLGVRAGAEAALDATTGTGVGHAVAGVTAADRPAEQVRV